MRSCSAVLVIAVLVAASLSCFAQSFTPASVVLSNGDSVDGEVLFKDWNISPTTIEFRPQQQSAIDQSDITGFKIYQGNRSYERVRINLKYYLQTVSQDRSPIRIEKPTDVFAEVIYSNALLRLYSMGDEEKTERFLLRKEGGDIVELIDFSYEIRAEKGAVIKHNPIYQSQLRQILADCDFGGTAVGYQESAIVRVLDKYSACRGITSTRKRSGVDGLANLGVLLGTGAVPTGIDPNPTRNVQAPVFGLALQFLSRKNFENRFCLVEVGVITGNLEGLIPMEHIHLAVYAGTFFGKRNLQGLVYSGASRYSGFFDTGLGISYKKKMTLVLGTSPGNLLTNRGFSIKLRYHPRFKAPGN